VTQWCSLSAHEIVFRRAPAAIPRYRSVNFSVKFSRRRASSLLFTIGNRILMAITLKRQHTPEEKNIILQRQGRECFATGHAIPEQESTIQRAVTGGISASVTLESTGNAWMEQIPRECVTGQRQITKAEKRAI
jgi:hypothetical protein